MENRRNKIHHPIVTSGVILAVVGLAISFLSSVNFLENRIVSNTGEIRHEREMRVSETGNIEEKIDDLKENLDQFKKEVKETAKESTNEIKNLINQLINKPVRK